MADFNRKKWGGHKYGSAVRTELLKCLLFSSPLTIEITKCQKNIRGNSFIVNNLCWGWLLFQGCCTKLPEGQKKHLWNNCLWFADDIASFPRYFIWNWTCLRTLLLYHKFLYISLIYFFLIVNTILSENHVLIWPDTLFLFSISLDLLLGINVRKKKKAFEEFWCNWIYLPVCLYICQRLLKWNV